MTTSAEVADWIAGLDVVVERIAARFGRSEPRRRASAYLRGLLSPIERKNGWQPAEAVGDRTPDGVQEFLSRTRWDADAMRDDLQAYVVEQFGDTDAVSVLDETGCNLLVFLIILKNEGMTEHGGGEVPPCDLECNARRYFSEINR